MSCIPLSLNRFFALIIVDCFLYLQTTILDSRLFSSFCGAEEFFSHCLSVGLFKACFFLSKLSTVLLCHVLLWYHDPFYISSLKKVSGDAKLKRWRKLVYSQISESALMLSLTPFPREFLGFSINCEIWWFCLQWWMTGCLNTGHTVCYQSQHFTTLPLQRLLLHFYC